MRDVVTLPTSTTCQERSFHDWEAHHYLRFRAWFNATENDTLLTSFLFSETA